MNILFGYTYSDAGNSRLLSHNFSAKQSTPSKWADRKLIQPLYDSDGGVVVTNADGSRDFLNA